MPTRWHRTPAGYIRVPPPYCPACGWAWPRTGPYRPREGAMFCTCTPDRMHTLWTCRCGALVAEGCTDVTRWNPATTPAGLDEDARWTC